MRRLTLRLDELEVPYAALDAASSRLAGLLAARGLEPGDRVGIMLPNVPYLAIAYYGVLRAGGVVVPMNVLLKERETSFYLSDPEARAAELRVFVKERVAAYKYPRKVWLVDDLPKGPTGKILKREIAIPVEA